MSDGETLAKNIHAFLHTKQEGASINEIRLFLYSVASDAAYQTVCEVLENMVESGVVCASVTKGLPTYPFEVIAYSARGSSQ